MITLLNLKLNCYIKSYLTKWKIILIAIKLFEFYQNSDYIMIAMI